MEFEELLPICSNCSYFFPASMEEPSEYGICLHDKVFEPYIDELIENYNYNPCQELVENKKFPGDTEACEHFEEPEEFEIDDNSHFGRELINIKNTGKLDVKAIKTALVLDEIEKIDWSTIPIDKHVAQLSSPDKEKQLNALLNLSTCANSGNEQALDHLAKYFKELPAPKTLDEVHFKLDVFRYIEYINNKSIIIPILIDELYHIQSNNTTRQWISKILKYLERCPKDLVRDPLEKLLENRTFSQRLKNRIMNIIFTCD